MKLIWEERNETEDFVQIGSWESLWSYHFQRKRKPLITWNWGLKCDSIYFIKCFCERKTNPRCSFGDKWSGWFEKKARGTWIWCKFDLEKAYDHVNWEFLDFIMLKMGFGTRWGMWISFCISIVRYSELQLMWISQ